MKKTLFLFLFIVISISCFSQESSTYTSYCEIVGSGNFSGNKIKISFDFGTQGFSYKASDNNTLVDEKGNELEFSSMIEALNYMAKLGWKLDVAYSSAIKGMGAQETYRYIIKKDVSNTDDIFKGIYIMGKVKKKVPDDLYR